MTSNCITPHTHIYLWLPGNCQQTHTHKYTCTYIHTRTQVGHIAWHPSAANILVSVGFDHKIIIWNTSTGETAFTLEGFHPDIIYSISWNYNGSLIATTCKDKKIRIIDPRKNEIVMVSWNYIWLSLLFCVHVESTQTPNFPG